MPIFKAPNNDTCLAETAPDGWVEITLQEFEAIQESRRVLPEPPSPIDQIRALEATNADKVAKITRQALLMQTVAIALTTPEGQALAAGMTQEQAKAAATAYLIQKDPGFKLMWELEQAIEPLRAQIP
jgi:hypothetical protein